MEAHFGCVHVRFCRIGQLGCCFWVLFVRFCGIGQTCTGFGFCLSVSVESDKHAPVLGFVCPFLPNRTHADWGMVG